METISEEVLKFTKNADKWWDVSGPFGMLHEINPVRLQYIISQIRNHYGLGLELDNLKILDVGCGGGIVSIPLSRLCANVTGIDLGKENIDVATQKAKSEGLDAEFLNIKISDLVNSEKKYDVVLCLEVLEHVENPELFLGDLAKLVKDNGILIVSTINRNIKSRLLAIELAEKFLKIVPNGTHSYESFITPLELKKQSSNYGLELNNLKGMKYSIIKRGWILSEDCSVNYFATFIKNTSYIY